MTISEEFQGRNAIEKVYDASGKVIGMRAVETGVVYPVDDSVVKQAPTAGGSSDRHLQPVLDEFGRGDVIGRDVSGALHVLGR